MSSPLHRRLPATGLAALLVSGGAAVAADGLRSPSTEDRPRLVVGASGPLFDAVALRPGGGAVACLRVENAGRGRGRAALFAPSVEGPLARHLELTVTRGRGGDRSCAGFAGDARAYGLDAPGVLFRGRLSEFPASVASAVLDPAVWPAGAARAYRFALELGDDPAAEGLAARWDLRLAAEALEAPPAAPPVSTAGRRASSSAPPGCGRVQLAGAARGRASRTLVKTARVRGRVRSVLVVRVLGAAGAERVVLTTGLRVRGKTLVIPRWARVTYAVNASRRASAVRRPFRVRVPAGRIVPGANRITVRVRPRRGRSTTTTFVLRATTTTIGGRRLCVLGT